jgi:hypothetical protein
MIPVTDPKKLPRTVIEYDPWTRLYKVWRREKIALTCYGPKTVDYEIAEFIQWLNFVGVCTVMSCAGHLYLDKYGNVELVTGPEIIVHHIVSKEVAKKMCDFLENVFEKNMKLFKRFDVNPYASGYKTSIWYREFEKFYVAGTIDRAIHPEEVDRAVIEILPRKVTKKTVEYYREYKELKFEYGQITAEELDEIRYKGLTWTYLIIERELEI